MNKEDSVYLHYIRHELADKLHSSFRGWRCWRKLSRMGTRGQHAVVLIPQGDAELSYYALAYLEQMLKSRELSKAIIATNDPFVIKCGEVFSKYILAIKQLTAQEVSELLQLYCMYRFDKNFIVASLEYPRGRNGTSLIGVKGVSKEEIFVVGVYGLYPFFWAEHPVYKGDDLELANLLESMGKKNAVIRKPS